MIETQKTKTTKDLTSIAFVVPQIAKDFYAMEALELLLPANDFRHSMQKLKDDVYNHRRTINSILALRLDDYFVLAGLREARHAKERAEGCWELKGSRSWNGLTKTCTREVCLKALLALFKQVWSNDFGGIAWYNIMLHTYNRSTMPTISWIDTALHMQHNTSNALNKGVNGTELIQFINWMTWKTSTATPRELITFARNDESKQLIQRFGVLCDQSIEFMTSVSGSLLEYNPTKYGTRLSLTIVPEDTDYEEIKIKDGYGRRK